MAVATESTAPLVSVVAFGVRERARDLLKRAFPRRRGKVTLVRTRNEVLDALKDSLADAVIVDLAHASDEHWKVAALARDFPSIPFLALAPLRPAELTPAARACLECEFADLIVEGAEDSLPRELVMPVSFTTRFSAALSPAHANIGLTTDLQREVWSLIVGQGGRPVRTEALAEAVQLTREHLSRRFSMDGAPNLKRVIDLVRLLAAAELAKNPGYDLPDVARVLGFASATHLSTSSVRVIGVKSASLTRLRPVELMDRFVKQGRGRSRRVVRD